MPIESNLLLTGIEPEPLEGRILTLLDEAGLELWQAPEGFWAIRAKRTMVTEQPARSTRKRRQEGRA
jgi:hypothetical protein